MIGTEEKREREFNKVRGSVERIFMMALCSSYEVVNKLSEPSNNSIINLIITDLEEGIGPR